MTDGEIGDSPNLGSGRQPLPPEESASSPDPSDTEWWRMAPPPPASPPTARPEPAPAPDADQVPPSEDDGASGSEWWRSSSVRDEVRDAWATHGQEGLQAAYEIGAQIGEVVAAHLPSPYAAAERRGLDIRWLRLKLNVPAVLISLLVTWRGQSAEDRMLHAVTTDGIFAPLGWVLLPALLLGLLMLLPFGSALGAVFAELFQALLRGVAALTVRAWRTPYIGYLLRLAVAVAVWSFIIAVVRLIGRGLIHWLTGV